jgi:hypothetical protein
MAATRSRSVPDSIASSTSRVDRPVSFSEPTTSARSYWPERTSPSATWSADEDEAHAFSTLITGVAPYSGPPSATWPRIEC